MTIITSLINHRMLSHIVMVYSIMAGASHTAIVRIFA